VLKLGKKGHLIPGEAIKEGEGGTTGMRSWVGGKGKERGGIYVRRDKKKRRFDP